MVHELIHSNACRRVVQEGCRNRISSVIVEEANYRSIVR